MLSCPRLNALLLITNSDEGQSFSYGDEWDKGDLIYAGKGLKGHQQLKGVNRYVAENSRELYLFEYAGSERLLFHDRVTCVDDWEGSTPTAKGKSAASSSSAFGRWVANGCSGTHAPKRTGTPTHPIATHRLFSPETLIQTASPLSAARALQKIPKAAASGRNRPTDSTKQFFESLVSG